MCFAIVQSLAAAPVAQAETTGLTWYVHGLATPDGADSKLDFSPPKGDETDNTATQTGATGSPKWTVHSDAAAPLATALAALGTEGSGKVWIKAWNGAPAPNVVVTMTVTADGKTIATGVSDPANVVNEIKEFDVPLTLSATEVAAGAKLALDVDIQTSTCSCYIATAYPRGSSVDHPWQFTLPLGGAAPASILYRLLPAGPVTVEEQITEPTTETIQYNWTTATGSPAFDFHAFVSAGTISLQALDGANQTAYTKSWNVTAEDKAAPQGREGAWRIVVTLTAFQGNFTFNLGLPETAVTADHPGLTGPGAAPGGKASAADKSAPSSGVPKVANGVTTGIDAKKSSPAPAGALLLACLLGLAWASRRQA